ncbi:MAG: hypothetical protein ABW171_07785 [Steroidobacter sp.]
MSKPNPPSSSERLERFIDSALRDQPMRRAPGDFESKVMAAIAQRMVPWWQTSFAHWPMAARVLFLAASIVFVKLGLDGVALVLGPIDPAARGAALFAELAWIHALFVSIFAVLRSLPSWWIYAGAAVIGVFYLMLFGVSAAAYRTLYASR